MLPGCLPGASRGLPGGLSEASRGLPGGFPGAWLPGSFPGATKCICFFCNFWQVDGFGRACWPASLLGAFRGFPGASRGPPELPGMPFGCLPEASRQLPGSFSEATGCVLPRYSQSLPGSLSEVQGPSPGGRRQGAEPLDNLNHDNNNDGSNISRQWLSS